MPAIARAYGLSASALAPSSLIGEVEDFPTWTVALAGFWGYIRRVMLVTLVGRFCCVQNGSLLTMSFNCIFPVEAIFLHSDEKSYFKSIASAELSVLEMNALAALKPPPSV